MGSRYKGARRAAAWGEAVRVAIGEGRAWEAAELATVAAHEGRAELRRRRRRAQSRARTDAYRSLGMVRTREGGWE